MASPPSRKETPEGDGSAMSACPCGARHVMVMIYGFHNCAKCARDLPKGAMVRRCPECPGNAICTDCVALTVLPPGQGHSVQIAAPPAPTAGGPQVHVTNNGADANSDDDDASPPAGGGTLVHTQGDLSSSTNEKSSTTSTHKTPNVCDGWITTWADGTRVIRFAPEHLQCLQHLFHGFGDRRGKNESGEPIGDALTLPAALVWSFANPLQLVWRKHRDFPGKEERRFLSQPRFLPGGPPYIYNVKGVDSIPPQIQSKWITKFLPYCLTRNSKWSAVYQAEFGLARQYLGKGKPHEWCPKRIIQLVKQSIKHHWVDVLDLLLQSVNVLQLWSNYVIRPAENYHQKPENLSLVQLASLSDSRQVLRRVLDEYEEKREMVEADVNLNAFLNSDTEEMLWHAAALGDEEQVQMLVDFGATLSNPDDASLLKRASSPCTRRTPHPRAVEILHKSFGSELIKLLKAWGDGSPRDLIDAGGWTPECLEYLFAKTDYLEVDPIPNLVGKLSWITPVWSPGRFEGSRQTIGEEQFALLLKYFGQDQIVGSMCHEGDEETDVQTWTPEIRNFYLRLASSHDAPKVVQLLATAPSDFGWGTLGVNINAKDEQGNTALILASKKGHVEVVKVLLSAAEELELDVQVQ